MDSSNPVHSPYKSGVHIDNLTGDTNDYITSTYQSLTGSFNWLSCISRPDLSTIVGLLSQYNSRPTSGHLAAAQHVLRYLRSTSNLGISYRSDAPSPFIDTYNHFPLPTSSPSDIILAHSDANWGPQDASPPNSSTPSPPPELPLHHSLSISGFVVHLCGGPIHWRSRRQDRTARSSAEAEIIATDEATKCLIEISNILSDLNVSKLFIPPNSPLLIYNDNKGCVDWTKTTVTKGTRHVQIRETAVRESIQSGFLSVRHIQGAHNLADIFTKEMKDASHFADIRDCLMTRC